MERNKKLSPSTSYPNMAGRVKCGVTEDMLDLFDDEAKWWVTNYPLQAPIIERGKIALDKFRAKYLKNEAEILKKSAAMVGKATDADDKDSIDIAAAAINNELMRPEYRRAIKILHLKTTTCWIKLKQKVESLVVLSLSQEKNKSKRGNGINKVLSQELQRR